MHLSLTLDEALARGEVLAERTSESVGVIRVENWVYKYLKPLGPDPRRNAKFHWRQIQLRVAESRRWPEFIPLTYDEATHCLVAPFVDGRAASREEAANLADYLRRTGRGYLMDISENNVLVAADQMIVIDFFVAEDHIDWRRRRAVSQP